MEELAYWRVFQSKKPWKCPWTLEFNLGEFLLSRQRNMNNQKNPAPASAGA
jgi:hypothetical protein